MLCKNLGWLESILGHSDKPDSLKYSPSSFHHVIKNTFLTWGHFRTFTQTWQAQVQSKLAHLHVAPGLSTLGWACLRTVQAHLVCIVNCMCTYSAIFGAKRKCRCNSSRTVYSNPGYQQIFQYVRNAEVQGPVIATDEWIIVNSRCVTKLINFISSSRSPTNLMSLPSWKLLDCKTIRPIWNESAELDPFPLSLDI